MYYFLKDFIGVSKKVADKDSCEMEHLMSQESIEKLFKFMKNLSCDSVDKNKLLKNISPSIDLTTFNSPQDFIDQQKGDKYLENN